MNEPDEQISGWSPLQRSAPLVQRQAPATHSGVSPEQAAPLFTHAPAVLQVCGCAAMQRVDGGMHATQLLFRHTGSEAPHAVVSADVHSTHELSEQIRPGPQSGVSSHATQLPLTQASMQAMPMSVHTPPLQLCGWSGSAGSQRGASPTVQLAQVGTPPDSTHANGLQLMLSVHLRILQT